MKTRSTHIIYNSILILLFTSFFYLGANAQLNEVRQTTIEFENAPRAALQILIEPDQKEAEKGVTKYLKSNHGVKLKGSKLLEAEAVILGVVSGKTMDFYVRSEETQEGTKLSFMGRFGYDIYLNPEEYPQEFSSMRTMVNDFMSSYLGDWYAEQIDDAQKSLGSTSKDRAKSLSEINKLKNKNADKEEEIAEITEEIRENRSEIEEISAEVKDFDEVIAEKTDRLERIRQKLQQVSANK